MIIPPTENFYDQRILKNLANSLKKFSNECKVLLRPLNDNEIIKEIDINTNIDVLFLVNKFPTEKIRKKNFRCIIWIQDLFLNSLYEYDNSCLKDGDIIYFLADKKVLGFERKIKIKNSYLFTGVSDYFISNFKVSNPKNDLALLGYFGNLIYFDTRNKAPKDLNKNSEFNHYKNVTITENVMFNISKYIENLPKKNLIKLFFKKFFFKQKKKPGYNRINNLVYKYIYVGLIRKFLIYTKLKFVILKIKGKNFNFNYHNLVIKLIYKIFRKYMYFEDIKWIITESYLPLTGSLDINNLNKKIEDSINNNPKGLNAAKNYLTREYPRVIDRHVLSSLMINSKKKVIFSGNGLEYENWKFLSKFIQKNDFTENFLVNFYQNSKINLNNNNHGLGMHSRVLESMACGGMIMMHKNKYTNETSLENYFEKELDYGEYSTKSFDEDINYFIENFSLRKKIILNAHKKIKEYHTWDARAKQILDDLK